jgi:hypothetical protein
MAKRIPILLNGKKWIQLSASEKMSIQTWLPSCQLKNILFQGITLSDCLDFDTYACWFRLQEVGPAKTPVLDF